MQLMGCQNPRTYELSIDLSFSVLFVSLDVSFSPGLVVLSLVPSAVTRTRNLTYGKCVSEWTVNVCI